MSDQINRYKTNLSEFFGNKNAFTFWKGRVALYAILKAMGIGPGDEVIVPGYTCVVDVNPVKYLGAKPVYVDIDPASYNIDINLLKEKITPNTKVIMAQHTYGLPCDLDPIMDLADANNIKVVEDCCHAFGPTYKGKLVGTFGRAAYFSGQWNKPFTTGIGGMLITGDDELAEKIDQLCESELVQPSAKEVFMLFAQLCVYRTFIYPRTTAMAQNLFRFLTKKGLVVGSSTTSELNLEVAPDFFKAMSSVQAASGIRQMKKIQKNISHRKKITALYDQLLKEKGWPVLEYDSSIMDPVIIRYPVRITERSKALEQAASAGIELGDWFDCPLHAAEAPLKAYDYTPGQCPNAEKACNEVVNLPTHMRVSEKTARKTVGFITKFKTPA